MKMVLLLLGVVCAMASLVVGGSVTAWPPSAVSLPLLRAAVIPSSRGIAYATTQYLNSVPLSYPFGLQPAYQVPQAISAVAPYPSPFYPFGGGSYFPAAGGVYYPSLSPIAPQEPAFLPPSPTTPQQPIETPAGDSDTSIVDSAQFPEQSQLQPSAEEPSPAPPSQAPAPQFPPAGTPSFPQFPQFPQGSVPAFPSLPQFPEGTFPGFPSLPQFPSNPVLPQAPPTQSAFPSADREDKGLNDEDTVSVESARK